MEGLTVTFPVSGVQVALWLPPLVAFVISFFTSMVGISGAFLLLPFQMSVLGYTTPSVSATNMVFNLVAIPGGVYRYLREGRMVWVLTAVLAAGTLPGIAIGYFVRVLYLPDPQAFKLFVACVLLYIAWRLFAGCLPRNPAAATDREAARHHASPAAPVAAQTVHLTPARAVFSCQGRHYDFSVPAMLLLAFVVGIIGGIYGIGGGALIAPFCITLFRLPVYTVAGAALAATLLTSVFGVLFYSLLPAPPGLSTHPDWLLGLSFGVGGLGGMYLGARLQKYIPQALLKLMLGGLLLGLAVRYMVEFLQ